MGFIWRLYKGFIGVCFSINGVGFPNIRVPF